MTEQERKFSFPNSALAPNGNVITTKPTAKDFSRWLQFTMDETAEELFGEFGYATCTEEEQRAIIADIYERELIE